MNVQKEHMGDTLVYLAQHGTSKLRQAFLEKKKKKPKLSPLFKPKYLYETPALSRGHAYSQTFCTPII